MKSTPFSWLMVTSLLLSGLLPALGADRAETVRALLDPVFRDPAFERSLWGVKVVSVDSGEVLYELNPYTYVMPASNMKLITAMAALTRLGSDFVFETPVMTDGRIDNGVLAGNLIVRGSGDPTIGARLSSPDPEDFHKGEPRDVFEEWAEKLEGLGIHRIEGDVVGNDDIFDRTGPAEGWSWDDLPRGYAAPSSALQFNEGIATAFLTSGEQPGEPVTLRLLPHSSAFSITNQVVTTPPEAESNLEIARDHSDFRLLGGLPAGSGETPVSLSIENPTLYFVTVLREALIERGIEVSGAPVDEDELSVPPPKASLRTLFTHQSPPLSWILRVLLKVSQNLYAESLVRALDLAVTAKSYEGGFRQVEGVLDRAGIPSDGYVLSDGSGLSRYNLVTADTMTRILDHIHRQPFREEFMEWLPSAGKDGTLKARMLRSSAEGKVRAKTGTLTAVRALSGYVVTDGGETLAFSMIANNFTQPRQAAEYLQDQALRILARLK